RSRTPGARVGIMGFEFLLILGGGLLVLGPIIIIVLQFSILARQNETMELVRSLLGDVRRELRRSRRDAEFAEKGGVGAVAAALATEPPRSSSEQFAAPAIVAQEAAASSLRPVTQPQSPIEAGAVIPSTWEEAAETVAPTPAETIP